MKRFLFIVLVLLLFPGEAFAALMYKDEVEEYFKDKTFYSGHEVTFVEYACERPEGFSSRQVYIIGSKYSLAGGTPVSGGVYVLAKSLGGYKYQVLKLKSETCDDQSECDQYKELFNPPASDCSFTIDLVAQCKDGEGNVIYSSYKITASDGRSEVFNVGDLSGEVQCENTVSGSDPKPFNPKDDPGTSVDDPVGNFPIIVIPSGDSGGTGGTGGTGGDDGGGTGGIRILFDLQYSGPEISSYKF